MNIRSSMYRTVSLLIIVPFLLFSLFISCIYSNKLENVIEESLQAVANAQIAQMTNFCQQQMNDLIITGDMEVSRTALRGNLDNDTLKYLNNILYSHVQSTGYMKRVAMVDANYRVVACSEESDVIFAHDGIKTLIDDMANAPFYISNVLVNSDSSAEKVVVAISKIEDGTEVLGYTLAEISLDFYDDIRKQTELWKESTFYLLDGQKQIISAGTTMENRESFVTTDEERSDYNKKYNAIDLKKNPKGSFSYKVESKNYITYYSDVEYTNWEFLLTVNLDNYLAGRIIYGILGGILALLCAVLAVWIGSFTSRRIVRPIRSISDTLMDIQQEQDYSLRIDTQRKDELGNLSIKINDLLGFIETENLYKAKQQRLLQQKAERDALTKALNKEHITQYLREAVECRRTSGSAMAVLFVDVDDFKAFNTDYGHEVGDQVLLFLTSLLERETNGTVGRIGGDEFLVIVETPENLQTLEQCLERIKKFTCTQFFLRDKGQKLPVFCCIGAVRVNFAAAGKDADAGYLVKLADKAMYQVKNNGKHGYIIWDYGTN